MEWVIIITVIREVSSALLFSAFFNDFQEVVDEFLDDVDLMREFTNG